MGLNPMDRARSREVLETAIASVGRRAERALAGVDLTGPLPALGASEPPQRAAA